MKPSLSSTSYRHPRRASGRLGFLVHRRIGAPRTIALDSLGEDDRLIYDAATRRVREAGGPVDVASYTCECGYVFAAPVSTSVLCPHCGDTQAW